MIEHSGVTRDELISAAFDILESARAGSPIIGEDGRPVLYDGEPIMARDLSTANQAIEDIGKLAGLWIERREVITRPCAMSDWTETQLEAELERIEAEIAKRKRANAAAVELRAVESGKGDKSGWFVTHFVTHGRRPITLANDPSRLAGRNT